MDKATIGLKKSVYTLFYIGLFGQAAFAIYIFVHLGLSGMNKNWQVWTDGMANGIIEGDEIGNIALILHVLLAFLITVGGPVQFIASIRKKYANFHKWNGRIYILLVMLTSLVGLFLVWSRPIVIGGAIGLNGSMATSGNALLIIIFSIMTWVEAVQGRFDSHREWAIRTYIVVCGVWFFRIGFGTWFLVTGFSAPGVTNDLTGWFDKLLYFGSYLGPLTIAEIYLRVKKSNNEKYKRWLSIFLYLLCPLLIGGTLVTIKVFWMG